MNGKKLLFCVFVCVCVLACLVACADGETTTAHTTTTAAPLAQFESLKIADNELSSYTIVYAESELKSAAAKNPKYYPVWDYDKETAERLAALILRTTGVELNVVCDTEAAETEYEILIGKTNRAASTANKPSKLSEYNIVVSDTKLVVYGGKCGTTWHAIDYVEELFEKQLADGCGAYSFAGDFTYTGTFEFTYIGCIGDSITQGVKVSTGNHTYSAQMERLLWKDVVVYNFGNSGKTMRDDLAHSYMKTNTFKQALLKAPIVDIFTVMLGTNDSNRDQTWTAADTAKFKQSCEMLFKTLKEKNNDMQFVIMNAPACFEERIDAKFGTETVRDIQYELVAEMNEKGYKTSFFDMYSVTLPLAAYYPDNLHPDDDGHAVMAQELAKAIQLLLDAEK